MPMEVWGELAYYKKSKGDKIRGKDRKGYRGGSILKALAGPDSVVIDGHMAERDTRLIEGLSIVGADDLTARDEALYQLMLQIAREEGVARDFHQIDPVPLGHPDGRRERPHPRGV